MPFALYLCFFLSGAAGLLYEIYWAQRFSLLLGLDVYSHAAVLTAFMGGLALGSHLAGRWADSLRRPWAGYAILEFGIAASGVLIPIVLGLFREPLAWMYQTTGHAVGPMTLIRFGIAVAVLLIPTGLMGATLPVMTLALRTHRERLGEIVGRLYAMNTVGAVVGVLAGGFVLAELIGLLGTNYVAVALNVAAALIALTLGGAATAVAAHKTEHCGHVNPPNARFCRECGAPLQSAPGAEPAAEAPTAAPTPVAPAAAEATMPGPAWMLALGAGLTGAAAMMTQIGWIRALSASVGSSTYAFTLIVAVFLVGIAIGARLAAGIVRRWRDAAVPWGLSCLVATLACLAVMYPLGQLPLWTSRLLDHMVYRLWPMPLMWTTLGLVSLAILIVPTVAMGVTLPLAIEAYWQRRARGTARVTGSVYAVNTIGAMLGSALGGLLFVEHLGIQGTLRLAAALYAVPLLMAWGAAAAGDRRSISRGLVRIGGMAVACWVVGGLVFSGTQALSRFPVTAASLATGGAWSRDIMILGPFTRHRPVPGQRIAWYREAPEATIAILEFPPTPAKVLMINGKPDGGNTEDVGTMVLLGQLPLMLHGQAKDVALIGLGAGITLRSVLAHDVRSVDMIELSKAVVEAVHPPDGSPGPFDDVNHRGLDDDRVNVIIGDGRNHIWLTDTKYDVILSQPSNPWVAGVSSLFTSEYFEACRQRLNEGGILCQWLHSYDLRPMEFFRILRTIHDVFDETTLWISSGGVDYFIIGSRSPKPAYDQVEGFFLQERVRKDLASIDIRRPADLFGLHLFRLADVMDRDVGRDVGVPARLTPNTDNQNRLRYTAARSLWEPHTTATYVGMNDFRTLPYSWLGTPGSMPDVSAEELVAIEDMQDAMTVMVMMDEWTQPTYRQTAARAFLAMGQRTFRTPYIERDLAANTAPPRDHEKHSRDLAGLMLNSARNQLSLAVDAKDPQVARRHLRNARIQAHLSATATPNDPQPLITLAEAWQRLRRTTEARQVVARARAAGATLPPSLEREFGRSP